MSTWRKVAIEKLPEFKVAIQSSDTPLALWTELELEFSRLYSRSDLNDDLIRRFYEYAFWCLGSPGEGKHASEAGSAAFMFFENVAADKNASKDIYRWITREQFLGLTNAFKYLLSEHEYNQFASAFFSKVGK